jgi:hydrogenase maturation factor
VNLGKLSGEELQKLLKCIKKDSRVIVSPMLGYDSGVHMLGNKAVVVATDPCIGVPDEWFGWLMINYAASDVAVFGAKPEFCTITLLGPLATKQEVFLGIMQRACRAADELGVAIVRGHTGTYDGIGKPVGVCTAYGTTTKEKLITPRNAKAGDLILCTKPIGLETAVNFSLTHTGLAERLFGEEKTKKLPGLVHMQTCVREALRLAAIDGVHAMHDATEGGLVTALNEVAEASNLGFNVDFENIPSHPEVDALRRAFHLSDEEFLAMSSTGTILAAVNPTVKDEIEKALGELGLKASFIGTFTSRSKRVLNKKSGETPFPTVADDPYARILSGKV